ncbi:MAG: hypothetical protein ACP5JG_08150, partial [Anaerolineae bacterium]
TRIAGVLEDTGSRLETLIVGSGADVAELAGASLELRIDTALVTPWLEQTMGPDATSLTTTDAWVSQLLPAVASYRALEELGADPESLASVRTIIADALDRLYARQNPDGGWGWWRGLSNVHLTSYATFGILRAQAAGFPVRADALNRGLNYVSQMIDRGLAAELLYPHFAFGLYVLSEADSPWPQGAAAALYGARDDLGIAGRSYLAQALWRVDSSDPRVMTLVSELRTAAVESGSGVHWEEINREQWVTPVQATAVVVDALASVAPEDDRLPQAVRWLMAARDATRWATAYETAWTITAMADYLAATGEVGPGYSWSAAVNGVTLYEDEAAEMTPTGGRTIHVDMVGSAGVPLRPGLNVIEVARGPGAGRLYYTAQLQQTVPLENAEPEYRGIWITREYCRVTETSGISEPRSVCEPVRDLVVGELVDVELTIIVPQTRYFVLVEDRFSAGIEPIDPSLYSSVPFGHVPIKGDVDPFVERNFQSDRVRFFARHLAPGTYQVAYRVRAAVPGTYHALPATVSEVYFPEVWGSSGIAALHVMSGTR